MFLQRFSLLTANNRLTSRPILTKQLCNPIKIFLLLCCISCRARLAISPPSLQHYNFSRKHATITNSSKPVATLAVHDDCQDDAEAPANEESHADPVPRKIKPAKSVKFRKSVPVVEIVQRDPPQQPDEPESILKPNPPATRYLTRSQPKRDVEEAEFEEDRDKTTKRIRALLARLNLSRDEERAFPAMIKAGIVISMTYKQAVNDTKYGVQWKEAVVGEIIQLIESGLEKKSFCQTMRTWSLRSGSLISS